MGGTAACRAVVTLLMLVLAAGQAPTMSCPAAGQVNVTQALLACGGSGPLDSTQCGACVSGIAASLPAAYTASSRSFAWAVLTCTLPLLPASTATRAEQCVALVLGSSSGSSSTTTSTSSSTSSESSTGIPAPAPAPSSSSTSTDVSEVIVVTAQAATAAPTVIMQTMAPVPPQPSWTPPYTPTSVSQQQGSSPSKSRGLSGGAVAAVVIVVLFIVAACVCGVVYISRRRARQDVYHAFELPTRARY